MCENAEILRQTVREQGEAINLLIARVVDAEGIERSDRSAWLGRYCAIQSEIETRTAEQP